MTAETAPRANHFGHPCPTWCTANHDAEYDRVKPCPTWCTANHDAEHDRVKPVTDSHYSDPMTSGRLPWDVKVKLYQYADKFGHDKPEIELIAMTSIVFTDIRHAGGLAGIFEALADEPDPAERLRELAADVRAAAAAAGAEQ